MCRDDPLLVSARTVLSKTQSRRTRLPKKDYASIPSMVLGPDAYSIDGRLFGRRLLIRPRKSSEQYPINLLAWPISKMEVNSRSTRNLAKSIGRGLFAGLRCRFLILPNCVVFV